VSEKLSSRPEAPWALWTGLAGGLAAAVVSVMGILKSGSATAAIGFIFVPFVAAIAAIPAGIWGLALGHVWLHLRGVRHSSHPALQAKRQGKKIRLSLGSAWLARNTLTATALSDEIREWDKIGFELKIPELDDLERDNELALAS